MKRQAILAVFLWCLLPQLHAEDAQSAANASLSSSTSVLFNEIVAMDKKLFDAFNRQDIDVVKAIFSRDLEFYHDSDGLKNYEQNLADTRQIFKSNLNLQRRLVAGSMEVHPVPNYGAIQTGEHTFCHIEHDKNDCGTFKFVHIWKRDGSGWSLTRVLSFGH